MNVQDYRAEGYGLSQLIDQAKITRAEKDVEAAYIKPLVGRDLTDEERQSEPYRSAIMALSFLLVSQRSSVATRAGVKVKTTEQSSSPSYDEVLRQNAPTCARYLQDIAPTANVRREVNDICRLYFVTNFFFNSK